MSQLRECLRMTAVAIASSIEEQSQLRQSILDLQVEAVENCEAAEQSVQQTLRDLAKEKTLLEAEHARCTAAAAAAEDALAKATEKHRVEQSRLDEVEVILSAARGNNHEMRQEISSKETAITDLQAAARDLRTRCADAQLKRATRAADIDGLRREAAAEEDVESAVQAKNQSRIAVLHDMREKIHSLMQAAKVAAAAAANDKRAGVTVRAS